jgi:levansucrase
MPKSKHKSGAATILPTVIQSDWLATHLTHIDRVATPAVPKVAVTGMHAANSELDLWDMWPIETNDGQTFELSNRSLWMVLAAPKLKDPELRHNVARIRLFTLSDGCWIDEGPLFPDGFTPGSREWSGSAVIEPVTLRVTVYFTAAGRRGEPDVSVEQRIFASTGELQNNSNNLVITNWTTPAECFVADSHRYQRVSEGKAVPGKIKAFRDPAYFRDAASGAQHLFFTGSAGESESDYNGVIGVAIASGKQWKLLPPVVSAVGLNNELERPHMRLVDGFYYLFWSTHRKVFAPDAATGPTGLYGMVGESPLGPFKPLNGSALVAPNPETAPFQNYSWWVLPDLRVCSFIDYPKLQTVPDAVSARLRRENFGGVPAPFFTLALSGTKALVISD